MSGTPRSEKRQANKACEIYLSLHQAVTGNEEEKNIYKQSPAGLLTWIIIDECHRSAAEDSAYAVLLSGATQIGLTATPKGTMRFQISIYWRADHTHSLKQGTMTASCAPTRSSVST